MKLTRLFISAGYLTFAVLLTLLAAVFCLTSCGSKKSGADLTTPEKTMEAAMSALKEMDLKTFNECTDNYVETYTNWLGIPVGREYKVFNELLQPGIRKGKRFKANQELAEKIVENLSWEIIEVEEEEKSAEITLSVTNKNLTEAEGNYAVQLLEDLIESDGSGIGELFGNFWDLARLDMSGLISAIEATDEMCTSKVKVQLSKEDNGNWIVELNNDFVNAFMGDTDSEFYSEDIERRIESLEDEYEDKAEKWAEEIENKVEKWFQ